MNNSRVLQGFAPKLADHYEATVSSAPAEGRPRQNGDLMPVRKIPGSTLTYAVIFRQETDGRWVYGTDDGSLDPRMAAMVGHLLEVWPSIVATAVMQCPVCDGELPCDDLPGAFVVTVDLEDPAAGGAMGACKRCALTTDDDQLFEAFERSLPWMRPITKN